MAERTIAVAEVWDCCSAPSPCFEGCDGGRTVLAHQCSVCRRWSRSGPDSIHHHHLCPVPADAMAFATAGPRHVDGDGREVRRG